MFFWVWHMLGLVEKEPTFTLDSAFFLIINNSGSTSMWTELKFPWLGEKAFRYKNIRALSESYL